MKKILFLLTIVTISIVALSSCGYMFPNTATITINNKTSSGTTTVSGATSPTYAVTIVGAYIAKSSIPVSDSNNIAGGKEVTYKVSWFGGRTNLDLTALIEQTGGISAPLTLYTFQDMGPGDTITLTISDALSDSVVPNATTYKVEKNKK